MVRRILAGMARLPLLPVLALALVLLAVILFVRSPVAGAATFTSQWWSNLSPYPERACDSCGCEGPPEWITPGISARTGEVRWSMVVATSPGLTEPVVLELQWRSMLSGGTDFGSGVTCSLIWTAQKVILDQQNPNGNGGNAVYVRAPSGLVDYYVWDGDSYETSGCCTHQTLTVNGQGLLVLTDLDGATRQFNADGMIATYSDRNGVDTSFTWQNHKWTGMTDSLGKTWTIAHDPNTGYVTSITDPSSRVYEIEVDSYGDLVGILQPETPDQESGLETTLSFDSSHRLTAVENPAGRTPWQYAYVGSSGRLDYATGSTVSVSYSSGRTDVTDANGNVRRYHWTGNRVTKVEHWISGASAYATEYRWSGNDLVTIVRPRGNRIDFSRNAAGFVTTRRQKTTDTEQTSQDDIVETWGYTNNFVTSYVDPLGNTTTYGRDGYGNLTSVSYPNVTNPSSQTNVSKSMSYNGYGQLTQEQDEEGRVVAYEYWTTGDWVGLLRRVRVDPNGLNLTTEYGYDEFGTVETVRDPLSHTTTYDRDAMGRVVEVTNPLGARVQRHFDGNGNVVESNVENLDKDGTVVSANPWFTTTYTYGSHDQLLTITEEIDANTTRTTEFQYDDNLNRTRLIKPEGNQEAWTYNARDLVATHVRGYGAAGASTTTYGYDANGNLTSVESGRGKTTTFTVDLFDRRTQTRTPSATTSRPTTTRRAT